jgi:hypothetical protein
MHRRGGAGRQQTGRNMAKHATPATEWFDVPSQAIAEAIDLIQASQLSNYRYDPSTKKIVIG